MQLIRSEIDITNGIFLLMAILNDAWANPVMDCEAMFDQIPVAPYKAYFVGVVHGHGNARPLEVVHIHHGGCRTVCGGIYHLELASPRGDKVGRTILLNPRSSKRRLE